LHDLLDQLLELLLRVFTRVVPEQPLHHLVGEHASAHQRLENGVVERLHRALVLGSREVRIVEAARQQQVGQLRHQRLHVEIVEVGRNELAVLETQRPRAPGSRASGRSRLQK
jgi:hypothetical protein